MSDNPVRDRLLAGETVFGTMAFEFFTPGLAPTLAAAGAEYVIFDMEHSGAGVDTIKQQIAYARGAGIVPIIRVPGKAYHLVGPVLDSGARGIMAPLMETAEQAKDLADWCRYRPAGRRGLAFGIAHDAYVGEDPAGTMARANDGMLVIALIESETGIANAEEIVATPGIDVGWLGHYDLTDSMGIPGRWDDPRFSEAADALAAACARHGKAAGFMDGDLEFVRSMMARGYRAIGYGTDVALMRSAYRSGLTALKQH